MTTGLLASPGTPSPGTSGADATPRSFLPLPAPLAPRARRVHRLLLALILAFGLAKGAYWSVITPVWNPVDEVQHYGYVESLARGHGIPTVGRDLLSDDVMASLKSSPTSGYRNEPYQPTSADPNWVSTRNQYEAVHGPIYYALMTVPFWVGRPAGVGGSLLAIRLATVLLALAAVPLTWLLARRLLPRRPAVWLLAPALLVTVSGLSFGSVTNDALVLTLGTASIVAMIRALSRPSRWWTLGAGLLLGLTLVTKTSAAGLIPFLGLAYVAWLIVTRPGWRASLSWLGWFALGGTIAVAPWLAWNELTYHAISASKAVDALTGAVQHPTPLTAEGIRSHSDGARFGLWVTQLAVDGPYRVFWERLLVGSMVVGLVAAAVRRSWRELVAVAWCALALPLAFAGVEVLVFVFFGGNGGPTGRYFYGSMAPTMVMIAAAAVLVLGRYWGPVAITALITWSLVLESRLVTELVDRTYLATVIDHRLAPAVTQTWSDGLVVAPPIVADPGCPVEVVQLGLPAPPPASITVTDSKGTQKAALDRQPAGLPRYRVERPTDGPITIRLPAKATINAAIDDRSPQVHFDGAPGDPVIRLYCDQGSRSAAEDIGFAELFPAQHGHVSLDAVHRYPDLLVGAAGAATIGTFAWAALSTVDDLRRRRRPAPVAADTLPPS